MSSSDRVVELLNNASIATDNQEKLRDLKVVQELLVHKDPALLDNFLDEVMGFQSDRSQDVRKFVVGFIEEACKKDPSILPKVVANLSLLLSDSAVQVQKRVIQAMTHLYRVTLQWLSSAKSVSDDMEAVWKMVASIKDQIVKWLDANNEGVRTHVVKFMEMLVLTQTHRDETQTAAEGGAKKDAFALDDVPLTLKIARRRKLEEEATEIFEELVKYHGLTHISSANLMTTMGALTNIARARPKQFMAMVITALEMLQANLPPTLARSQVSSVRKHLKNQLLTLLKHPLASDQFFTNITTLLTDLGASKEEVMKAMPRFEEMKRRARKKAASQMESEKAKSDAESKAKRAKLDTPDDEEDDDDEEEDDDDEEEEEKNKTLSDNQVASAVDITEAFILERMSPLFATELVMRSMSKLPREIPPHFHNTYTPIAAAGTEGQVKHVSRLLATQLTSAKLGPGVVAVKKAKMEKKMKEERMEEEEEKIKAEGKAGKISTVIGGSVNEKGEKVAAGQKKAKVTLQPSGLSASKRSRNRAVKLADVTHPLPTDEKTELMKGAIRRILLAGKTAVNGGVTKVRHKIITALAAQHSSEYKSILLGFIFEDLSGRSDLAFSWLYEEYCFYQGFNRTASLLKARSDDSEYNAILCNLIRGTIDRTDGGEREELLRRLYLEAPIITEDAIQLLKQFIQIQGTAIAVVNLMKDLVMRRPTKKLNFLNFLLEFCSHELAEVRETANGTVLQLHRNGDFNDIIEDYSVMYLRFLLSSAPPSMLFGEDRGRSLVLQTWTEDIIKVCLYLYLSLLPQNLKLFAHLAEVYIATTPEVKRMILRLLDSSVRNIDINDPQLLDLIENCPKGSETLVTRVIHILTDKTAPPPELVEKVKEMYGTRVSDVRFLIPVLNGLQKSDVVAALPKLIALTPVVVKDVFARLATAVNGPMSASDLLIELHKIDPSRGNMKDVIKATTFCFQDKQVFNQEVISIALQQLLQLTSIPLLFMRTVIQSVTVHPKLIGFVMEILRKLIVKTVWNQPKIWDGFIKCCEKTVPQSYAVVLQLPPAQLGAFLDASKNMREPILQYVQNFNESQRAHISAETMAVLYDADVMAAGLREAPAAEERMETNEDREEDEAPPGE